jgi:hypothetical protein
MKKSFRIFTITVLGGMLFFPQVSSQTRSKPVAYTSKINGSDVVICPVNRVKDTLDLKLSDLVESCQIIKLDNNPEGFYDRSWHLEISDKHICIKSYGQQPAKLYDKSGKYICNIGKLGRGPGEYPTLSGLQFSPDGKKLYLFPFGTTRKILEYDLSGKYLRDIPLAFTQRKFKAFISRDSIITVLSMPFRNDSAICYQQDFKGKMLRKVSPPSYLLNESFDGEVFTNFLTPEYDLYNTATDTLYNYNISKNRLEPKFAKDFGGFKTITVSREIPGYYYFSFRDQDKKSRMICVDKKTLDAKYFRLKNDFFGNVESQMIFSNGYFYNSVAAITLKKQIETALKNRDLPEKERQKLLEFDRNLKADDNNIIFYGKLKKV